jgi:hypothetical protein
MLVIHASMRFGGVTVNLLVALIVSTTSEPDYLLQRVTSSLIVRCQPDINQLRFSVKRQQGNSCHRALILQLKSLLARTICVVK